MPQPLYCHAHAGEFPHRRGADLHCSAECAKQHQAAQSIMEEVLRQTGFSQPKDLPANLWERNGVHISIEEVLREGLDSTLARHQEAVNARL